MTELNQNDESTISLQKQIFSEELKLLYENLILSLPSSLFCATLIFYGLYDESLVLYWYSMMCLITIIRFCSLYVYKYHIQNESINFYIFLIGSIVTASAWGSISLLFMSQASLLQQMLIIIIIAGVSAGSIQSLQANLYTSISYAIIVIFPLSTWLLLQEGVMHYLVGISLTLYLLFTIIIAWRGYRLIEKSLKLRFENTILVNSLLKSNNQLDQSYKILKNNEETLHKIQENAPIGMAIVSLEGKWLEVNQSICDIVGYSRTELQKLTFQEITLPEDLDKDLAYVDQLLANKIKSYQMEKRYYHKNGQPVWVLLTVTLMRDEGGKPLYFITQVLNIDDRKRNEKRIAELNEKTNAMLEELKDREREMIAIQKMTEILQVCQESNEAYSIIAHTAEELFTHFGGGLAILNKITNQMEIKKQWGMSAVLKSEFSIEDCWGLRRGHPYIIQNSQSELNCYHFSTTQPGNYICLPLLSENGVIGMLFINSMEDIISTHYQQLVFSFGEAIKLSLINIQLREILREQAIRDPLTGLFNRRYLYETLSLELLRVIRENHLLCSAMIDIDHFKIFNDKHGHAAGDKVLKLVATILQKNFRGSDIACRYGGEEFMIILIGSDLHDATLRMQSVCDEIRKTQLQYDNAILPQVTVSIGIAEAPTQGRTAEDIIRMADIALYHAKQNGRNRIEVFKNE